MSTPKVNYNKMVQTGLDLLPFLGGKFMISQDVKSQCRGKILNLPKRDVKGKCTWAAESSTTSGPRGGHCLQL